MPQLPNFNIEFPAIKGAGVYYFNTYSGIRYEVRFGRRQNNVLHTIIVFGVVNDEFDGEEYIVTNKGEVYKVMNTIVEILNDFMTLHPKNNIYEFHAIDREDEHLHSRIKNKIKGNARLKLYQRYLPKIFNNNWNIDFNGNNVTVTKNN